MKNKKFAISMTLLFVLAILVLTGWLHDFITLSGGRTVYTVDCSGGVWRGSTCTGRLVPGERYRFKVLRPHGEVLFWTAGSNAPSGKLSDCVIVNAREWACRRAPGEPQPIMHAMKNGHAVAMGAQVPTHHSVEKWKWLMLEQGATFFHDADT